MPVGLAGKGCSVTAIADGAFVTNSDFVSGDGKLGVLVPIVRVSFLETVIQFPKLGLLTEYNTRVDASIG